MSALMASACKGGVSPSQALAWNRRSSCFAKRRSVEMVNIYFNCEGEDPKRQTPRGAEYREAQRRGGLSER